MPDNIIPLRPDRTAQDRSPPEPHSPARSIMDGLEQAAAHARGDLKAREHVFRSDNLREPRVDPHELLRRSGYHPSLAEKLADAFGSEFGAGFYCGVWAGAMFTVIAAYFVAVL